MGAFAGAFLAVLTMWVGYSSSLGEAYGIEPHVRLPYSTKGPAACLYETSVITISVDAEARIYLSLDNRPGQTEAIRQAAACYGVVLTERQVTSLAQLPYLGLDLRQLPAYLALPAYERRQLQLPGIPNDTLLPQLADCVMLARSQAIQHAGSSPYIALRMDSRLPAAEVRAVIKALQQRGLNRFYLVQVGQG